MLSETHPLSNKSFVPPSACLLKQQDLHRRIQIKTSQVSFVLFSSLGQLGPHRSFLLLEYFDTAFHQRGPYPPIRPYRFLFCRTFRPALLWKGKCVIPPQGRHCGGHPFPFFPYLSCPTIAVSAAVFVVHVTFGISTLIFPRHRCFSPPRPSLV